MRLSKFLAHSGVCSRRDAEKLIKENKVIINNNVNSIFDYKYEDFSLIDYNPDEHIKAPVSV